MISNILNIIKNIKVRKQFRSKNRKNLSKLAFDGVKKMKQCQFRFMLSIKPYNREAKKTKMDPEQNEEPCPNNQEVLQKMRITEDMGRIFQRLTQIFGNVETIVGKNITATMFWYIIDTLYFSKNNSIELSQIKKIRDAKLFHNGISNIFDFESNSEEELILRLCKSVSNNKGTTNLHNIRYTPIDEVIDALESEHIEKKLQIDEKIKSLHHSIEQQNLQFENTYSSLQIKPRHCHPMFQYEQFQEQLAHDWKIQEEKNASIPKCHICHQPSGLISCKSCHFKVHKSCYPPLEDEGKDKEKTQADFICENCRLEIDEQKQICVVCPCRGGSFLQTIKKQPYSEIHLQPPKAELTPKTVTHLDFSIHKKQQRKNMNIHVSCFLWNSQCNWNKKHSIVDNIDKVDKKKAHGSCSLCGLTFGLLVACSNETCRRFYHAECARRNNLQLILIKAKTSTVIELYCGRHRHLKKYEALYESHESKLREVRKLFEGVDKELKRISISNSFPQIKSVFDKDVCIVCLMEEGSHKIHVCKDCRKWYHTACSSQCPNCHNFI